MLLIRMATVASGWESMCVKKPIAESRESFREYFYFVSYYQLPENVAISYCVPNLMDMGRGGQILRIVHVC